MRIGTWNVEYAFDSRNADRLKMLMAMNADIWVLTETHNDLKLPAPYFAVNSEPRPIFANRKVDPDSTWVTIWSRFPMIRRIPVPDKRRMIAAEFETTLGSIAVAGVVLPWHDDIGDTGDTPVTERPAQWEQHKRVLRDQFPILLKSIREESGGAKRVVAGDFNSHLALPYPLSYPYPHDEILRQGLANLLSENSLRCHTADELYPLPLLPKMVPQTLIDHICTDFGHVTRVETRSGIDGTTPRLSDHPGIVVSLEEGN